MICTNNKRFRILLVIIIIATNFNFNTAKTQDVHKLENTDKQYGKSCQNLCLTTGCFREATFFLDIMDTTVDPCYNFYKFVCGNFMKYKNIPTSMNTINMFTIAQSKISVKIYREIKAPIKRNELNAFKKLKTYYRNCMNKVLIEAEGTEPVFKILKNIGGWPILLGNNWNENTFDWEKTFYKIVDENIIPSFPLLFLVTIDKNNSTRTVLNVASTLTTISETYVLDGPNNKLLKAYYDFMAKTATAFGANKNDILEEIKECYEFEYNIFKIKTPPEVLLAESVNENRLTIKELSTKFPSIPWLKLINKMLNRAHISVNETEKIVINDIKFISKLEKLIKITPKRVIANYMIWKVVQSLLSYMPEKFQRIESDFINAVDGTSQIPSKEAKCVAESMKIFPISLSAMYVRKYFSKHMKENIFDLIQNVKNETKIHLEEQIDWMDDETRKAAVEKLKSMKVFVGYADELMDDKKVNEYYSDLDINSGSYLNSALNASSFAMTKLYKDLGKPVDKNSWTLHESAIIINAYYLLQTNSIEIPAGFLQSPFFAVDRPQYLNYGATGTVIGHEITHAFDNNGRRFDVNGNYDNWWQAETEKKYLQKVQCIIDQYDNFTVPQVGLHVNGVITQGENIADNGGFKTAYYAYKKWATRNQISEDCLPFLNYTPKQMFWISAASNWCSKESPEHLKEEIAGDTHSPNIARVVVSFSNMKEFAEDFNCKIGSKMNPEKKCVVW